jgi:carbonic anhydrase
VCSSDLSRRKFVSAAGLTAGGFVLGFAAKSLIPQVPLAALPSVTTPAEALDRLMAGNERFAAVASIHPNLSMERRAQVSLGQQPWAVILGCIDSRVPPEIVFDQGLGDLFVARTAGQVIDNVVLGSVEYAVEEGAKLIMVLGHHNCGAVKATVSAVENNTHAEGQIETLVEAIKPAVIAAKGQPGDLVDNTVRANVALEIQQLKSSSEIISHALSSGAINMVGARYDLETGIVEVLNS